MNCVFEKYNKILLNRVSEKVSTPTSVILMALNTVTGKNFVFGQILIDIGT